MYNTTRSLFNIHVKASLSPTMKNENQACRAQSVEVHTANIATYTNAMAGTDLFPTLLPVFVNPRLMFPSARDNSWNSRAECVRLLRHHRGINSGIRPTQPSGNSPRVKKEKQGKKRGRKGRFYKRLWTRSAYEESS